MNKTSQRILTVFLEVYVDSLNLVCVTHKAFPINPLRERERERERERDEKININIIKL